MLLKVHSTELPSSADGEGILMSSWFSSEGRSEFLPKRVPDDSWQVTAPTKTNVSQERGGGTTAKCCGFDPFVIIVRSSLVLHIACCLLLACYDVLSCERELGASMERSLELGASMELERVRTLSRSSFFPQL